MISGTSAMATVHSSETNISEITIQNYIQPHFSKAVLHDSMLNYNLSTVVCFSLDRFILTN